MQTDRGIYHKRVCDRCGAVQGGRMMNPDEYFKDWAWLFTTPKMRKFLTIRLTNFLGLRLFATI